MRSLAAQLRRIQADQRRQERESRLRQKELEKRLKEREKLSALEQARLEVEAHENALEVLLSIHREQSAPIEWAKYATAHIPWEAGSWHRHEFLASLKRDVAQLENAAALESLPIDAARMLDQTHEQAARVEYAEQLAELERMRLLAKRVLMGEAEAYSEVLEEFSSFDEIAGLSSSVRMTVHGAKIIGCVLTVSGRDAIPSETKSLTAAGKLSIKPIPKQRFQEIYQEYVCSCVLRIAREILAMLPVDTVIVTASVNGLDLCTGQETVIPVLSVGFERGTIEKLDFQHVNPSDAMANFMVRGDARPSRKTGEFVTIVPLCPEDVNLADSKKIDFTGFLNQIRELRSEIAAELEKLNTAHDHEGTWRIAGRH